MIGFLLLNSLNLLGQNDESSNQNIVTRQEPTESIKFGLSGRISNFFLVDQLNSSISIPFFINSIVKIEPEFSYYSEKVHDIMSTAFTDKSFLHFGIGLSYLKTYEKGFFNIGLRAGIIKGWTNSKAISGSNYYAGPVIGYDHFLSKNFALGLDINPYFLKLENINIFKTNTSIKVSMIF